MKAWALVVVAIAGTSCAVTGRRVATGVQKSVSEGQAAAVEGSGVAEVAGERAVRGAVKELSSPEATEEIGAAVDAAVARGLARLHRDLAAGEGRLARDLDATVERASGSAVRGVRRELDDVLDETFAACGELDRRACLRREVHALGEEASAGFVDGILRSNVWGLGLVVFLLGAVAALLARAAWGRIGNGRRLGRSAGA